MKITALVENHSRGGLEAKHGLSLYIEMPGHTLLFDLGPAGPLLHNAALRHIDLAAVDTVIISHGHQDHGGALGEFLAINKKAKVYAQRAAFDKHYSELDGEKRDVGLDAALRDHPQVVLLDGDYAIDDALFLFVVGDQSRCHSPANDVLYTDYGKDDFRHEHSLIIKGEENTLIMGCGHAGIVNILRRAEEYAPKVCVGGYHLLNPQTGKTVPETILEEIASELAKRDIRYYTCHCTGQEAYDFLAERVKGMAYLACGESILV